MAIASLPMYDLAEVRGANDRFWRALSKNMRQNGLSGVPARLVHDQPVHQLWSDPEMLISQCCGYDVIERYKDRLRPVATPNFSALGCLGENYCSVVVVADDCRFCDVRDMAGAIAVINGPESHSGMSALRHLVARHSTKGRFFSGVKISGSHLDSLDMVRRKIADIAAIDSVTLTLLRRYRHNIMDGLKVLGTTYAAPAPPYVVRANLGEDDVMKIRQSLLETFKDPALAACREQLLLKGISLTQQEDYWVHEAFKDHALKHGFPSLQ